MLYNLRLWLKSDGVYQLDIGWLTNQTEIRITLLEDPIKIWKRDHINSGYRIKCKLMDMRFQEVKKVIYNWNILGIFLFVYIKTKLQFSVFASK